MRRVLAVAALGLLWAQAARAQGEPAVFGEDYSPADALGGLAGGILMDGKFALMPPAKEPEALLVKALCDAPSLQPGGGKNVDGSWFDQIQQSESRLSWDSLFCDLDITCCHHPVCQPFDSYLGLEALYWLSFFDSLAPLTVGPYMGPVFKESEGWHFLYLSGDCGL